jgi:hypothetical protein
MDVRHISALAIGAVLAACGGETAPSAVQQPATWTPTEAAVVASYRLSGDTIAIQLRSTSGAPIVGAVVHWSTTGTGSSISPAVSTTNAAGIAAAHWQIGTGSGVQAGTAQVEGVQGQFTFVNTVFAAPGPPASIRIVSGDLQSGTRSSALADSLVVTVVDQFENTVPGVTVSWLAVADSGTVSPTTTTTDAHGRVAVKWTLGGATPLQAVRASVSGLPTLRFTATVAQ